MLKLFKRTKNKKRQNPNVEDPPNQSAISNATISSSPSDLNTKTKSILKGKTTSTESVKQQRHKLDANKQYEGKNVTNDRTEKKSAKIFFENIGGKNENSNANENEHQQNIAAASIANDDHQAVGKTDANFTTNDNEDGRKSVTGWNDFASHQEERARRPARRKTFSFRRVDLDGVNSIVEAIQLESNALSSNERAEWSGRRSSNCSSNAIEPEETQSNVNRITTIGGVSNNNELITFKSNNGRSIEQNVEAVTKKRSNSFDGGQRDVNGEEVFEIPKRKKAVHRRSYIEGRKKSNEPITDENCENSSESFVDQVQQTVTEKSQGPLEKGKRFLSSIFMARGRHHQSQRNHRSQVTQKSASLKQLKAEPCGSKSHDQNSAVNIDHKRRQIVTSNKNDSTIRSDSRTITQNPTATVSGDQTDRLNMLRQHLETTSSPIVRQNDPTASVKIYLSNNSSKSASRRDTSSRVGNSQQRSNSAELPRERRESVRNKQNANYMERAYSEEPQGNPQRWSGANIIGNARVHLAKEDNDEEDEESVSKAMKDSIGLTRGANIEENVASAEESENCTIKRTIEHTSEQLRGANETVKLTACPRRDQSESESSQNRKKQDAEERGIRVDAISMGQTYAKNETSAEDTRASTSREFRDSIIPETGGTVNLERPVIVVPKITVEDFSVGKCMKSSANDDTPTESEIFFEFENENPSPSRPLNNTNNLIGRNIQTNSDSDDEDHEEFHEQLAKSQPNPFINYRPHSPLLARHSPIQLEDVPEQEEEEEDEAEDDEANRPSVSPDRFPLKSTDSNLSNSYPDSGISGCSEPQGRSIHGTTESNGIKNTSKIRVRDSASTDCDDSALQCDDFDCYTASEIAGDRLVCIESISLPDVVESTTSIPGSGANAQISSSAAQGGAAGNAGEQIININGATGNTMGNVHFVPIQVEGERLTAGRQRSVSPNQKKQRSVDDSIIGNGTNSMRFAHFNGDKPTIEIIEEDEQANSQKNGNNSEKLRFELEEQKTRLSAKLDDAQKNVHSLEAKINDMQSKIVNLEQELSTKTWNVERLQSELNASQREDEFVRKKLRLLQDEKTELRHKFNENEDEFRRRYDELESEYKELQEKYKNTQQLASGLHGQLAAAQTEAAQWRTEVDKIRCELEEQIKILKSALENSEAERKICEDKWQKEYEMLRTQHMDREETLMTDCEWQIRQMQKQWKDKLDKSEHARRDAIDQAEMTGMELEARKREVEDLRHYEAEVKSLRGVVTEQQNSITVLMNQIENLKADLQAANSRLEDQIEAVAKIKFQCNNAICDKERQMVYRIDEVRNEAASFWENKLYTEMTRLKNELEMVYVDERREALDKLQVEHIEELRALTTRYTANEDELRTELAELQEKFDTKCQDFLELREKTDSTLLQTRMHLDRADREYQNAMCREEERREALEESLRKEFENEKQEMELKFQERLNEVREEFDKELQNSKQEMINKYKNELEQQKAKLKAEKDAAVQEIVERYRQKLANAEEQMKEMELRHQRDLNELKASYDEDKTLLDKRDMSNANEIEQLHRRCRCLTNLFEEMRMRYERREPRPEDLREIDELRARCESQERDLFTLTATLREIQMQQSEKTTKKGGAGKAVQKPPPKIIPTNCDVIYEENEERDSPPPVPLVAPLNKTNKTEAAAEPIDDDDGDDEDEDSVEDEKPMKKARSTNCKQPKLINGGSSDF